MTAQVWVACAYRVPREPSRLRLAVWRRLKRLGAIAVHDAVWLLPAGPTTREALEWLAEEIEEEGGTPFLWEAVSLGKAQDRALIARFQAEADARYGAIAESAGVVAKLPGRRRPVGGGALDQARRQLAGLERGLRLEARRDYFHASGRRAAEAAIAAARRALERPGEGGRRDAVGY